MISVVLPPSPQLIVYSSLFFSLLLSMASFGFSSSERPLLSLFFALPLSYIISLYQAPSFRSQLQNIVATPQLASSIDI